MNCSDAHGGKVRQSAGKAAVLLLRDQIIYRVENKETGDKKQIIRNGKQEMD